MKLIIAGSRTLNPSHGFLWGAIKMLGIIEISEVVCGMAEGVDLEGMHFASHAGILLAQFPADWKQHGKAAGPIRNKQMAEYADALLLIWDGESRGSANMKKEMQKLKKPIYEVILKKPNETW